MTRSRLRNKFLKTKTDANRKAYNKQRNYCVSLIRRERKSFFNNLDTKGIVNNRRFQWPTIIRGIAGAGSGFPVGWRTGGGVNFCSGGVFC